MAVAQATLTSERTTTVGASNRATDSRPEVDGESPPQGSEAERPMTSPQQVARGARRGSEVNAMPEEN